MQTSEINALIDRARKAYQRRAPAGSPMPKIDDCDIFVRRGRDFIHLMDGEATIAVFSVRANGELKLEHGKTQ